MKLLFRIFLALAALLLALFAYLSLSHQPEPFPEGSVSARRLAPGPWSVAVYAETFEDRARETRANGDYPGDSRRSLPGRVWYPREAEAGARPLLLFSHGFTSTWRNGRYLGEHLASHGFVVVAVDYPLTNMSAPGGALVEDVVNQPGDVSFLIDTLLGYSAVSGHSLSGKIDGERIGVLGISLGGLTSTLVGYHPRWHDERVTAVLSIAGPTNFLTARFFAGGGPPFMMLAGDLDALVPYESNALPVPDKVPGAELLTVHGGSHTGFSGGTALLRAMKNTDAIGCYSVQRFIDADDQWEDLLLGTAEEGIDSSAPNQLCEVDPLPRAMNVLRQQMIARVAVRAFFEKYLAHDAAVRAAAAQFLAVELARELPDVSYRAGVRRSVAGPSA